MVTRRKSKTTTPRMLGWKRSKVDKKDESVEEKEEKEAEEEEAWKDDEDGEELEEEENNAAMAPEEGRGRGRERGASPVRQTHATHPDCAHGGHVLQVGPLDERPDDEASGGRKVGVDERERGVGVRSQGGAGVEAGPTEPQHRPAQDDEGNVVRLHLGCVWGCSGHSLLGCPSRDRA